MSDDLTQAARGAAEMLRTRVRDSCNNYCSLEEMCDDCVSALAAAARLERAIEARPAPDAGLVEAIKEALECEDSTTADDILRAALAAHRQRPEPGLVVRLTKRLGKRWIHESDIADLAAEGRLESEVAAMVLEDLPELADGAEWSVTWTPRAGEED